MFEAAAVAHRSLTLAVLAVLLLQSTLPAHPSLPPAAATGRTLPAGRLGPREKWVLVDLHRRPQLVTCYEGSRVAEVYACSGSRFGTSDRGWAVAGKRRPRHRYPGSADTAAYWMQWWVGIVPDTEAGRKWANRRGFNGFHATPGGELATIGNPVSHGCIRLRPAEAHRFWKWVQTGVPVYFTHRRPADPAHLLAELRARRSLRPQPSQPGQRSPRNLGEILKRTVTHNQRTWE